MKKAFIKSFPNTVPVLAGYLSLGIAFGLLLEKAGFGPFWCLIMSVFIFAGTAQYLCVELLAVGASLWTVAIMVFVLNFRHFFYGISMVSRYNVKGIRRMYLIFGLTDETYAILTSTKPPVGIVENDYYFAVTLLDQFYWVAGSMIGSIAGTLITFNSDGLDFAMTALFAVLVVEQWKANKEHFPAIAGFVIAAVSLVIFGPDNFLIPALIVISGILLLVKDKIYKEEVLN